MQLFNMLLPLSLTSEGGSRSPGFDLAIRSMTTAALAIALVTAVVYESVSSGAPDRTLIGWAGIVIGFYFGGHVAVNGAQVAEASQQRAVAAAEKSATDAAASATEAHQP